ncbi:DUF6970 domain-containing protein [Hymenobacter cellulosilyticus]|uniref:DUF6970 domain-containing protein n=1 Tax=Hymenobacter cellulosilyticus TaxID=2932248 RepID=A0A8T9Q6I0_9BACT|nr:hypothetical protein [Hymenobacter cellulosilyticus]UOQ73236.1 hypothetical protein MUN79_04505 [Hymenobacter cellulosilyticus]
MRLFLSLAVSSLAIWLSTACGRGVAVNTPTDPPVSGNVNGNDTPNPTSTNTTDLRASATAAFDTTARPKWLADRIQAHLAEPKANPGVQISRYTYKGQVVYYETLGCCDQFSNVYNAKGKLICHPDGGLTGKGDGQCPDFDKNKTGESLVWRDPR